MVLTRERFNIEGYKSTFCAGFNYHFHGDSLAIAWGK